MDKQFIQLEQALANSAGGGCGNMFLSWSWSWRREWFGSLLGVAGHRLSTLQGSRSTAEPSSGLRWRWGVAGRRRLGETRAVQPRNTIELEFVGSWRGRLRVTQKDGKMVAMAIGSRRGDVDV